MYVRIVPSIPSSYYYDEKKKNIEQQTRVRYGTVPDRTSTVRYERITCRFHLKKKNGYTTG